MIIEFKMVTKMYTCLNCELPCEQNPYTLQLLQSVHLCNKPHTLINKKNGFFLCCALHTTKHHQLHDNILF